MTFGKFPLDISDFTQRFISEVCRERLTSSNTDWTRNVKKVLLLIGKEHGFTVSPDRSEGQREYLLDLIWQKPAPCADIILAVESEWGGKGPVLEDFEKLMHVKAPLKLMVFDSDRHDKRSESLRRDIEEKYMQTFSQHIAGEEYLLVEFAVPERKAYAYLLTLEKDGQQNEIHFREMLATAIRLAGDSGPLTQTVA